MNRPERVCGAEGCQQKPVIMWQRRATDAEWQAHVDQCVMRAREWRNAAPDEQKVHYPDQVFVPRDGLSLHIVYACADHGESAEPGIHEATCTPPCRCTPTTLPAGEDGSPNASQPVPIVRAAEPDPHA